MRRGYSEYASMHIPSKVIKPFHPDISRVMFMADLFEQTDQRFEVAPLLKLVEMEVRRVEEVI